MDVIGVSALLGANIIGAAWTGFRVSRFGFPLSVQRMLGSATPHVEEGDLTFHLEPASRAHKKNHDRS